MEPAQASHTGRRARRHRWPPHAHRPQVCYGGWDASTAPVLLSNQARKRGAPPESYEMWGEVLRVNGEVPAVLGQTPRAGVICEPFLHELICFQQIPLVTWQTWAWRRALEELLSQQTEGATGKARCLAPSPCPAFLFEELRIIICEALVKAAPLSYLQRENARTLTTKRQTRSWCNTGKGFPHERIFTSQWQEESKSHNYNWTVNTVAPCSICNQEPEGSGGGERVELSEFQVTILEE